MYFVLAGLIAATVYYRMSPQTHMNNRGDSTGSGAKTAISAFGVIFLNIVIFSDILLAASVASYYFLFLPAMSGGVLKIIIGVLFILGYAIGGALLGFFHAMALLAERVLSGAEGVAQRMVGVLSGAIIARFQNAASMSMSLDEFKRAVDEQIDLLARSGEAEGLFPKIVFAGRFFARLALKALKFVYMGEFLEKVEKEGGVVTAHNLKDFAGEKAVALVLDQVRVYTDMIRYAVYALSVLFAVLPFVVAYFLGYL